MLTKLEKLRLRITPEHADVFKCTEHIIKSIDDLIESHDRLVAIQSAEKIRPNGNEERAFHEAMYVARDNVILNLEKTLEDFEHKGDKNYIKNFKDGVE